MKTILFATALSVAALAAAPALAQGTAGVAVTHTEAEVGDFETDGKSFDIFAAAVAPLTGPWGVQMDGGINFVEDDDSDDDTTLNGALHLYHETPNNKVGAFVGANTGDEDTVWNGGVEGQVFLDNANLGAAVGYITSGESDVDGWGAVGSGALFLNDNFSLSAQLGFVSLEAEGVDVDGWNGGVGAEYQLPNTGVTLFAGYNHGEIEDADATADSITVGLSFNFSGTLLERERRGPSLNGLGSVGGLPL
jgi:hypothetical protein